MLRTIVSFSIVVVFLMSCAGNGQQAAEPGKVDTLSVAIAQIEKDVDATKRKLLDIQTSTLKELDSLQALLKEPAKVAQMKKEEYAEFQKTIAKRLSSIGKIAALETIDKEYSALLAELRNSGMDASQRKQKLAALKKASGAFKDSITVTIDRILQK